MGPLDPTPPMVTAGGMPGPLDQNAQMAELLRRKQAAQKQAALSSGNAEMWENTIGQPQFTQTVRGGGNAPDQTVVNWGDILGKGVSNYMGAKERKKSAAASEEVQSINNQFMESTLKNDPQASKLYTAVQAGLPGADRALSDHLAPKKQSLAVLTQFISGGGDPAMAAQLATEMGVDPDIAFKAAEYQNKTAEEKRASAFTDKVLLQGMKDKSRAETQAGKVGPGGFTQAELASMPIEERMAAIRSSTGRESAESKERGKLRVAAQRDLPKTDYALQNLNDVARMANEATYYPGTLGLAPNALDRTGNNAMLRQAISGLVLDATGGKLGGGVSNADVQFLKEAQANLESGNKATVVAQINKIIAGVDAHRKQMALDAGVEAPPSVVMEGPRSKLDYTSAKKLQPQADTFEEDAAGLNFGE